MKVLRITDERGERFLTQLERRMAEMYSPQLEEKVRKVVQTVARRGDQALVSYVRRHDLKGLPMESLRVQGRVEGSQEVDDEFVKAVELALANLKEFHEPQLPKGYTIEKDGGDLGIRVRPIESVGVYVPGEGAVGLSSLLMAVVPARIAGVARVAVATPPRVYLSSPHLRYLLDRLDLHEVYLMGGAHAIAALAYGTDSVTRVDKIVGPGGRVVAVAKRLVYGAVDIDGVEGPPEAVVVADGHAEPEIVTADLLAQAESDPDALVVLATPSKPLADKVARRLATRVKSLPKGAPARQALKNRGAIVLVPDLSAAIDVVNRIAPQQLELLVHEPLRLLDAVEGAGTVYLGPWTPAVLGDYVVGINHVLPSAGAARFASPLGVWDFVHRIGVVRVAAHRFPVLARAAATMAAEEKRPLHAESLRAGTRGKV
jgi:histidinol dehydrogenase